MEKLKEKYKRYTIIRNKVWLEVVEKDTVMAFRCVYTGKNKKDCEEWVKEHENNQRQF